MMPAIVVRAGTRLPGSGSDEGGRGVNVVPPLPGQVHDYYDREVSTH